MAHIFDPCELYVTIKKHDGSTLIHEQDMGSDKLSTFRVIETSLQRCFVG